MDADAIRALDIDATARLIDYAERPRAGDWTLRSALVRYAQRSPIAASAVLELVRRTDGALQPHRRRLEREPIAEVERSDEGDRVVQLLRVASVLDDLGDALTRWAADRAVLEPPVEEVDTLAADAFEQLGSLGVERERRQPRRAG